VLLVHDLLLAKKGIALPATHGLRAGVERHKARLQAEFTKARIRRKQASTEALKQYVDSGVEGGSNSEPRHPRWIRINALKTQLDDQIESTFADYERVGTIDAIRQPGSRRLYIDVHVPNLVAVPASIDLTKSEAYISGNIIFQDKASCFPAYMLDPLPQDGDIIDTCAAPGNKTTHVAAILTAHASELEDGNQTIHAFEKNKIRAETLKKMVNLAGSRDFTRIHAGQDFLKVDPNAPEYRNVGALLLDPSCSGSGIVGRDEMPELHLPVVKSCTTPAKNQGKLKVSKKESLKRKRDDDKEPLDMVDDDGVVTPMTSESDLQSRLQALSTFQLSLLLHAFAFPSAHKITYSTCSIHSAENETVVNQALNSDIAKTRGWRILRRDEQVRGLRDWPVRGDPEAFEGKDGDDMADACIRANKGDEHGTMGFFLAGFVRDRDSNGGDEPRGLVRDEKGFILRDLMGIPVTAEAGEGGDEGEGEEEWNGFGDDNNDDSTEKAGGQNVSSFGPIGAVNESASDSHHESKSSKKRTRKAGKAK
jgi:putative methyltransferase